MNSMKQELQYAIELQFALVAELLQENFLVQSLATKYSFNSQSVLL